MTAPFSGPAMGATTVLEKAALNITALATPRPALTNLRVYTADRSEIDGVLSPSGYGGPFDSFTVAFPPSSLNPGSPVAFTLDSQNAYWVSSPDGSVFSTSLSGEGANKLLAMGPPEPNDIAMDTTNVYWTNASDVMRVPFGAGSPSTPTILVSGQANPGPIAVDEVNVYWINLGDGSLMKVPLGGGSPTLIVPGQLGATSIAIDATSIYWSVNTASGSVLKIDK